MSFFLLFRLLVGAPEADAGQRGVVRGGAVYKCRPDSPGQCDLIQFDKEGQWEFSLIWLSDNLLVTFTYVCPMYVVRTFFHVHLFLTKCQGIKSTKQLLKFTLFFQLTLLISTEKQGQQWTFLPMNSPGFVINFIIKGTLL